MASRLLPAALASAALLTACSDLFGPGRPSLEGRLGDPLEVAAGNPFGIAVNQRDQVVLLIMGMNQAGRFGRSDTEIDDLSAIGDNPVDVTFSPDGSVAYVLSHGGSVIHRLAMGTGVVSGPFSAGAENLRVIRSQSGASLLLLSADGKVRKVSRTTFARQDSVMLGAPALGVDRRPHDGLLAVGAANTVYLLDPASLEIMESRDLGNEVKEVKFSPNGLQLFVAVEFASTVLKLDARTLGTIDSLHLTSEPFEPYGLGIAPDGRTLLATLPGSGGIAVIDPGPMRLRRILPAGGMPRRVAFSRDGRKAWVSNEYQRVEVVY